MAVILDSSAVIAYLLDEPGSVTVASRLDEALIAAPNAAEVISILIRRGSSESRAISTLRQIQIEVAPFDLSLALHTGSLIEGTRHLGLSLGDCACLALAIEKRAEVLTTDRQWAKLELPVRVTIIR